MLAGQFIQQIFVNSGGARYLPPPTAETVLLEDFAEDEIRPTRRQSFCRHWGLLNELATLVSRSSPRSCVAEAKSYENDLGLDPVEFRLVCIPYDLYARFGRERGFGQWPHWTHLDGYQVMAGNRLRALAGGDSRFGGLYDLVSISPSDGNEGIYSRFAVVRRARMAGRWR